MSEIKGTKYVPCKNGENHPFYNCPQFKIFSVGKELMWKGRVISVFVTFYRIKFVIHFTREDNGNSS